MHKTQYNEQKVNKTILKNLRGDKVRLKVEYIPISKLKPYDKNAKIHTKEQIEQIKKSITDFGMNDPIAIWGNDNLIVEGHGRLMACKELGYNEVPIIRLDGLTDEQRRAYTIVHNQTTMNTGFDIDILNEELESIDLDMSDYGFDIEIDDIEDGTEVKEDETPEVKDGEPKAKLGDIYQLGNHRLMCGDSTDVTAIDRLMDGINADMVFCDAPYGYKYESNYQDKYKMLQNDDKILDFIPAIWGTMKDNCPVYEFCGWQSLKQWLEYFENTSLDLKNVIIWKKNNWSMGDLKGAYAGQYEVILYLNKGRVELNGSRDTDIWEFDREPPKMHPTMKPIELIAYALNKSSKNEDVVLDCFGGSGSTLIACEQSNRKCYMMELDPHYVDVIIERWENFTGQKAKLLNEV